MLFIKNKYTRIYYQIVERARTRALEEYQEKHHIIPRSFYIKKSKTRWLDGNPDTSDNLVYLTAREHFICHLLLIKMTDEKGKYKMSFALKRFLYSQRHQSFINSRKYEYIKKFNSEQMKGRPCSLETREKIRQGNLNRAPISEETRNKLRAAAKRRKGLTEEGRRRISEANKLRKCTEEMKEHLRKINLGKTNWKQKGVPQPRLACLHCGLEGGQSAIKHWHFDKCRHVPINNRMDAINEIL